MTDPNPRQDAEADAEQPATERPASALEPTAVQAAQEANERDDLPDADTDTRQAEKAARGRR